MANFAKLKPGELTQYLNSYADLGTVMGPDQASRNLRKAGFRVAADPDGKTINGFRYAAWLFDQLQERKNRPSTPRSYEVLKNAAAQRSRNASISGRDIAPLPPVVNPRRKKYAERRFKYFCEQYFSDLFYIKWSPDHLKVIAKIEKAVLHGGLFALAMPRGSGKSTLAECAAVWAMLYGHREFVALIGATESAALEILEKIKIKLETNLILAEDFPEVCYPIKKLDGIANRCSGQTFNGVRTRIGWTANEIILPTIEGSPASGMIVRVAGITGRVRGMACQRPDGRIVRPSLVIVDDPQTNETANSVEQTNKRIRILSADILGLAGPGQKISGIMPCTVIRAGDMADKILNPELHPDWNGERTKLIYKFPVNEILWDRYAEIRSESLRRVGDISEATRFYRKNRKAMDEGAKIAWPARYEQDELSAIQNAMNLKLKDEASFMAEYQNDPLNEDKINTELLTVDQIAAKQNGLPRLHIPMECNTLTMFVDVHENLLFWTLSAWADNFTGYVIDYGTFPDQHNHDFTLRSARITMKKRFPELASREEYIYKSLHELISAKLSAEFPRDDGYIMNISRCLIDANWGQTTDIVYQFCRQSSYSALLTPSHGKGITASQRPITEYQRKPGEKLGLNWYFPNNKGKRAVRYVMFDANYWKSFIQQRLKTGMGGRGCLSLYGNNPQLHSLFASHLAAETYTETAGMGRRVEEWSLKPGSVENHWFDCLVGTAVGASIQGCELKETEIKRPEIRIVSMPSKFLRKK